MSIPSAWSDLIGCLTSTAETPFGMMAPEIMKSHGDMGREPETQGRRRLAILVDGLLSAAGDLASALGPEAEPRSAPVMSFIPSETGDLSSACCAWRCQDGRVFVASTTPLPSVTGADSRYSASTPGGAAFETKDPPPGWS